MHHKDVFKTFRVQRRYTAHTVILRLALCRFNFWPSATSPLSAVWRIALKCCKDIHGTQWMNRNYFGGFPALFNTRTQREMLLHITTFQHASMSRHLRLFSFRFVVIGVIWCNRATKTKQSPSKANCWRALHATCLQTVLHTLIIMW